MMLSTDVKFLKQTENPFYLFFFHLALFANAFLMFT